ncbi:MAG: NUDIX domain-containing protein [Planctomycetota bacterium]
MGGDGLETGRAVRRSGRVIVVDPRERLLLLRYRSGAAGDPAVTGIGAFWIVPGGKAEPDESVREAAARELFEETGIRRSASELGRPVGERRAELWIGGVLTPCEETYFLVRSDGERVSRAGWTELEIGDIEDVRWFDASELLASASWEAELAPRGAAWFYARCARGDVPGGITTLGTR